LTFAPLQNKRKTRNNWTSKIMSVSVVARGPGGRILPGHTAHPGGRPRRPGIQELRAEYQGRLPAYFQILDRIAKSDGHPHQLAAVKVLLDHLIGKPTVYVDAVHTSWGAAYLSALKLAYEPKSIDAEPGDPRSAMPPVAPAPR
jgi:hypothetical protein